MENKQNDFQRHFSFGRVFWGIFCIIAAVVIVLAQMGIITVVGMGVGTIVVLIIMLVILVASIPKLFWFGIWCPVVGIGFLLAEPLGFDVEHVSLWAVLLVAILLSIGFSVLFRRKKPHGPKGWHENDENFEQVINSPDGSDVYAKTHFGSAIKYINTDNLVHGFLDVRCGAMKVFFDNAKIADGQTAEVQISLSFGAIELYIPRGWTVVDQLHKRMSGIEEKGAPQQLAPDAPKLVLTGDVDVSGLTIIYT